MRRGKDEEAMDDSDVQVAGVAQATADLLKAVNASDLPGVLAVWSDGGILMAPHHPSVHGRAAIEQYFRGLFRRSRVTFSFTASRIEVSGDLAFERVEYAASVLPLADGPERHDAGKGVHVYRRQADGSWKLAMDIWNSDIPAA